MPTQFARAALAAALGLGVAAGLVCAQAPAVTGAIIVQDPLATGAAIGTPAKSLAPVPAYIDEPKHGPVRDFFRAHGLGCWSNLDSFGCRGLGAELTFMFGSCKSFYGEPCFPGPPPPLIPPGVVPPPGYGTSPRGCNCQSN